MTDINIYKGEFCISTDKLKLDLDAIHDFLSNKAYWCINIPKDKVQTAIYPYYLSLIVNKLLIVNQ
jgi:hypothetical protein